jgi:hypothetical protein
MRCLGGNVASEVFCFGGYTLSYTLTRRLDLSLA